MDLDFLVFFILLPKKLSGLYYLEREVDKILFRKV
jgi:hypothetical protein